MYSRPWIWLIRSYTRLTLKHPSWIRPKTNRTPAWSLCWRIIWMGCPQDILIICEKNERKYTSHHHSCPAPGYNGYGLTQTHLKLCPRKLTGVEGTPANPQFHRAQKVLASLWHCNMYIQEKDHCDHKNPILIKLFTVSRSCTSTYGRKRVFCAPKTFLFLTIVL
jgi:hypothetical protein